MPVGNVSFPDMLPIAGIRLAVAEAGVRYPNRKDLCLFELCPGTTTAAVFTTNLFCAAPVTLSKSHLGKVSPRYLLINTGNANAGTGELGMQAAIDCCKSLARITQVQAEEVLPFSTGVIGELLPTDRIQQSLVSLVENLADDHWPQAAQAILTTDIVPKGYSAEIRVGGRAVRISGIAKGSGMIHPNMATLLAYIATDAAIDQRLLQSLLSDCVQESFNAISVDGDTSTNDSLLLMATGKSGISFSKDHPEDLQLFKDALQQACVSLAQLVVRDGEGATKFVTVQIEGGTSKEECRQIGFAIAHSPLVKTALFASDPNWGRILAAIGRAGVADLAVSELEIFLGEVCIVAKGGRAASYTEELGKAEMTKDEILIRVDLHRGEFCQSIWTCDFSYDYVRINADYRS